jgi:hypothetical protein
MKLFIFLLTSIIIVAAFTLSSCGHEDGTSVVETPGLKPSVTPTTPSTDGPAVSPSPSPSVSPSPSASPSPSPSPCPTKHKKACEKGKKKDK